MHAAPLRIRLVANASHKRDVCTVLVSFESSARETRAVAGLSCKQVAKHPLARLAPRGYANVKQYASLSMFVAFWSNESFQGASTRADDRASHVRSGFETFDDYCLYNRVDFGKARV